MIVKAVKSDDLSFNAEIIADDLRVIILS